MSTQNNDFMDKPSPEIPANRLQSLYHRLNEAGFENVRLELSDGGELVEFSFRRGVSVELANTESWYGRILCIVREAGFGIGFEELALNVGRDVLNGAFLVRPLVEICR
jgi:hypothetical protein